MKELLYACSFLALVSCGNEIEEITNPATGTVLKRYEYYLDENGQKVKDGTYTEWNNDGTIRWTCNFKDGIQHGEEKVYITRDSIAYNNFKDGMFEGKSRIENKGVVIRELNFSKGELDGQQLYYHNNGKLNVKGYMDKNLPTKVWKHYDSMERLVATFNYNDWHTPKELIGKWVQKREDGKERFFVFGESGTAQFHEPYFKYQRDAILRIDGHLIMGAKLQITDGRRQIIMDIISYEKNKLVTRNSAGELETLIKQFK